MSKLLLLGMPLDEVIEASTFTPAKVLGKHDQIGTLKVGAYADIAILRIEKGKYSFVDTKGEGRIGKQKLAVTGVIWQGRVIV
jgi:dihydroorotase